MVDTQNAEQIPPTPNKKERVALEGTFSVSLLPGIRPSHTWNLPFQDQTA